MGLNDEYLNEKNILIENPLPKERINGNALNELMNDFTKDVFATKTKIKLIDGRKSTIIELKDLEKLIDNEGVVSKADALSIEQATGCLFDKAIINSFTTIPTNVNVDKVIEAISEKINSENNNLSELATDLIGVDVVMYEDMLKHISVMTLPTLRECIDNLLPPAIGIIEGYVRYEKYMVPATISNIVIFKDLLTIDVTGEELGCLTPDDTNTEKVISALTIFKDSIASNPMVKKVLYAASGEVDMCEVTSNTKDQDYRLVTLTPLLILRSISMKSLLKGIDHLDGIIDTSLKEMHDCIEIGDVHVDDLIGPINRAIEALFIVQVYIQLSFFMNNIS